MKVKANEIPVLDLASWLHGGNPESLVRQLREACLNIGFFYVAGHGVAPAVIENLEDEMKHYFSLPESYRLADRVDERFRRGYMPFGMSKQRDFDPDLKESFDFGVDLPLSDPDVEMHRPLHGPNRWPVHQTTLKSAAETYFEQTSILGRNLTRLFALALGKEEDFFLKHFTKPMVQTRLIHYPSQEQENSRHLGAAPHTDYGFLTLLIQDPIGGLELKTRSGDWIAAPYIPGTYVINLGDMFKVWTNDLFVSNLHRVINTTGRERFSIPTFFNPNFDTPVACLDTCRSTDNPERYPPILAGEYLTQRFRDIQGYRG
jgi:isopenicillin N synthase-like dioxygenase